MTVQQAWELQREADEVLAMLENRTNQTWAGKRHRAASLIRLLRAKLAEAEETLRATPPSDEALRAELSTLRQQLAEAGRGSGHSG